MIKFEQFIIKYRWWFIITPLVITVLASIPLLNTRINSDLETYLPDDTPSIINNNKLEAIFGDSDPVILIFEADDVLNLETLTRIKSLSKTFNTAAEFDGVISLFDTKNIKGEYGAMVVDPAVKRIPKSEKRKEQLREEIRSNELAYKLFVSEDFKYTLIILRVVPGVTDDEVIEAIDKALEAFPGEEKVHKAGYPYLRSQVNTDISRDMMVLMPIGLLIMMIFLFLSFREVRGVVLPISVVTMSIIISLGFFPLMGWELSIITILAPIMMIAIANNYGVHFITRYQELNAGNPDWSMQQITTNVLHHLKKPVVITGLTTIAGVLGLVVHILHPARQLGIAAALGIGFALIFSITFVPAIMAAQKKGKSRKGYIESRKGIINGSLNLFGNISTKWPILTLLVSGSILIFAGAGIVFLEVDSNSDNFLPPRHPFRIATSIANENFGGSKNMTILFEGDIKDPAVLRSMDHYETELEKMPEAGNVFSIASIIRIMSKALNDPGDPLYDTIPDSRDAVAQYLELYSMSGDPEDFDDFVDFDYTKALLNIQFRADTKSALDNVIDKVEELTENDPNRSIIGGYCLVDKEVAESIVRGQYYSLLFAIIIIGILLIIIFRSMQAGFLGSLPLIYTIIALFGTMGWIGIKLDIATAMLSSIAIGIGVDYTIHFFWRYKHELSSGKDYKEAINTTLQTTGRGIVINAFSVIVGFSVLFVSSFLTIKYFAFLIIFSIFVCLICALVLIPALCLVFKPKFLEKK